MTDLILTGAVAERVRKLAEQEKRSVEEVINTALDHQYTDTPVSESFTEFPEIFTKLRGVPNLYVPSENPPTPPVSEEELSKLAAEAGAQGTISDLIIDERKQGY